MEYNIEFSGGKDSTALLFKLIENGIHIDNVIRVDFGTEYPEMYKHIQEVEIQAKKCQSDINFIVLDLKDKWIEGLQKFGYPGVKNRWCTGFKTRAIKKITHNSIVAVGIAFDESERMFFDNKDTIYVFPLIDYKMSELDCLNYCFDLGFTFYGLYDKRKRVSCFSCPFTRNESILLMNKELCDKITEYENIAKSYHNPNWYFGLNYETFNEKKKRLEEKYKRKG